MFIFFLTFICFIYLYLIRQEYISVAWHYLLDNRITLEKMEELLQAWDSNTSSVRYDYNAFSSTATVFALDAAAVSYSKKVRQDFRSTSPTAIFEPSAKTLKDVSVLILTSVDVFPVLQQVDLEQLLVNQYINDLMNHSPMLTLRFARAYPEKISLSAYRKMVDKVYGFFFDFKFEMVY